MHNTSQLISNFHDSCSEIKERIKKTKDEKKAKKAEVAKSQKSQTKGAVQKGSKGPKLGGGGGKRWKGCCPTTTTTSPLTPSLSFTCRTKASFCKTSVKLARLALFQRCYHVYEEWIRYYLGKWLLTLCLLCDSVELNLMLIVWFCWVCLWRWIGLLFPKLLSCLTISASMACNRAATLVQ